MHTRRVPLGRAWRLVVSMLLRGDLGSRRVVIVQASVGPEVVLPSRGLVQEGLVQGVVA